jgi:hypothetical protein
LKERIKTMDNLEIYNKVREVPKEALSEIQAGRLRGKSDINPMWRIKALTETFGPCGFGWKYVIRNKHLEHGAGNETAAFVDIDLFIKQDGEWSEAIPGTGGSSFVTQEKNGPYTSDECFKMALTDAISVSCKALGIGADVYWGNDKTKYTTPPATPTPKPAPAAGAPANEATISEAQAKRLFAIAGGNEEKVRAVITKHGYTSTKMIKKSDYETISKEIAQ